MARSGRCRLQTCRDFGHLWKLLKKKPSVARMHACRVPCVYASAITCCGITTLFSIHYTLQGNLFSILVIYEMDMKFLVHVHVIDDMPLLPPSPSPPPSLPSFLLLHFLCVRRSWKHKFPSAHSTMHWTQKQKEYIHFNIPKNGVTKWTRLYNGRTKKQEKMKTWKRFIPTRYTSLYCFSIVHFLPHHSFIR